MVPSEAECRRVGWIWLPECQDPLLSFCDDGSGSLEFIKAGNLSAQQLYAFENWELRLSQGFTEVRCNNRTSYVDIVYEKAICMADIRSTVQ